jgi:hypothetical protein
LIRTNRTSCTNGAVGVSGYIVSVELPMSPVSESASRKTVTLPDTMWAAISEFRFYNRIPTEAEAIRQLMQRGLDLPHHLEPWKATVEILTGRCKHYPGPFSAAASSFDMIDALARELQGADPSLGSGQIAKQAEVMFRRAMQEAGADTDRARSLLNVNWRRFA